MNKLADICKLAEWLSVPELVCEYVIKALPLAQAVKEAGYIDPLYWSPETELFTAEPDDNLWIRLTPPVYDFKQAMEKSADISTVFGLTAPDFLRDTKLNYNPNPLTAALTGGAVMGGLGYGAGWLGDKLLPDDWDKSKLRRTLGTAGAMMGIAPGAILGMAQMHQKGLPGLVSPMNFGKQSSMTGGLNDYVVDVEEFNNTVWRDPFVANRMTPAMRAAASGLVSGASQAADPGGGARLITPMDMARVTAGMGSGYISGAIVGKVLGTLVGMPQPTQDRLKQIGLWSGVVNNIVPLAFGM